MKPSIVYLSMAVFMIGFIGGTNFLNSLYTNHNINDNTSIQIRDEYTEVQKEIGVGEYENNPESLYYKLNSKSYTGVDIVDQAVAGVLIVPKFMSILFSPVDIIDSAISGIENSSIGNYVPGFVFAGLRVAIWVTVGFMVLRLLLGLV